MSDVSLLIHNNKRPVWTPDIEALDILAEALAEIPLLGYVQAGEPVDLCETEESVRVPVTMVRKNTYALRVRGHSMIDDNIQEGDIIVIEKREYAHNGQTVVAMINGEQVTLKKFYVEADGIRLQPANPEMAPIILKNQDVQILGIVTGVIRSIEDK
jgi:repressor LexA